MIFAELPCGTPLATTLSDPRSDLTGASAATCAEPTAGTAWAPVDGMRARTGASTADAATNLLIRLSCSPIRTRVPVCAENAYLCTFGPRLPIRLVIRYPAPEPIPAATATDNMV